MSKERPWHRSAFVCSFLLLLAFSFIPVALAVEEQTEYQDQGFFVEYPSAWNLLSLGDSISGYLSIEGPCARISMNWTSDPGIEPSEILRMIRSAYDEDGKGALSWQQDEISMAGRKVQALTLNYDLQGHTAQKLFAAWNSSSSDRLFWHPFPPAAVMRAVRSSKGLWDLSGMS